MLLAAGILDRARCLEADDTTQAFPALAAIIVALDVADLAKSHPALDARAEIPAIRAEAIASRLILDGADGLVAPHADLCLPAGRAVEVVLVVLRGEVFLAGRADDHLPALLAVAVPIGALDLAQGGRALDAHPLGPALAAVQRSALALFAAHVLPAVLAGHGGPAPGAVPLAGLALLEADCLLAHHALVLHDLQVLLPEHHLLSGLQRDHPTLGLGVPALQGALLLVQVRHLLQADEPHAGTVLELRGDQGLASLLTCCGLPRIADHEGQHALDNLLSLLLVLGHRSVPVTVSQNLSVAEKPDDMLRRHLVAHLVNDSILQRLLHALVVVLLVAAQDEGWHFHLCSE
mmetsp:Transcript_9127/g.25523  ORF Transcript_9127/g.25523 Transcript_9127/m.25523 type:complete len:348 (+) Transcript_9127:2352-3395(+)